MSLLNWQKEIWIAKRTKVESGYYGVDIAEFEKPKKYYFNYQPVSSSTTFQKEGTDINADYQMFIDKNIYQGQFHVGDVAYLSDGETLESELKNMAENDNIYCENSNYIITRVDPQNIKIRISFERK